MSSVATRNPIYQHSFKCREKVGECNDLLCTQFCSNEDTTVYEGRDDNAGENSETLWLNFVRENKWVSI
jgi:hypothetical protein